MTRSRLATLAGLIFVAVYFAAVLILADVLSPMHWAVQFAYFVVAGIAWVWPVLLLIKWAVRSKN